LSRTIDQRVEAAGIAAFRPILIKEGQLVFIEDLKELVPGNFFECFFRRSEIDPQHPTFLGAFNARGAAVAGLDPFLDLRLSLFMFALLASSPHHTTILVLDGRTLLEISSAG
jgi:hypothetical protein